MQNLEISLYSYRFITETLFPHEQFKPIDVKPGGALHGLTQVFLDKLDPEDAIPVEVLFVARSARELSFKSYKLTPLQEHNLQSATNKVSTSFKKLTHTAELQQLPDLKKKFFERLMQLQHSFPVIKKHQALDPKFCEAFNAVETCLRLNPEKLEVFEKILEDWTNASPQYRARAINFDPFIHSLFDAMKKLTLDSELKPSQESQ